MIVRVGMIQCFLFHVLTGGRLVYKVNIQHKLAYQKVSDGGAGFLKTTLDNCDDDEYKRREVSGLLIRTGVTARK